LFAERRASRLSTELVKVRAERAVDTRVTHTMAFANIALVVLGVAVLYQVSKRRLFLVSQSLGCC